jgi:hypothetical protein
MTPLAHAPLDIRSPGADPTYIPHIAKRISE